MVDEQQKNNESKSSAYRDRAIFGVILIAIGIIFMLRNIEVVELDNWWALFILIPTIVAFANGWKLYQENGKQMSRQVRSRIIGGLFPLAVAVIFLLGLDFGNLWPVFIILAGIAVMLS